MHPQASARRPRTADRSPVSRTAARRHRRATTVARNRLFCLAARPPRPCRPPRPRAGSVCTSRPRGHPRTTPRTRDELFSTRVWRSVLEPAVVPRSCPGSRRAGTNAGGCPSGVRILGRGRRGGRSSTKSLFSASVGWNTVVGEEKDIGRTAVEHDLAVRDVPAVERVASIFTRHWLFDQVVDDALARAGTPSALAQYEARDMACTSGPRWSVKEDGRVARRGFDRRVHRDAVAQQMERRVCDVDHLSAVRPLDPMPRERSTPGSVPVEDLGAVLELDHAQRDVMGQASRPSHSDRSRVRSSRDRKELRDQRVELQADRVGLRNCGPVDRHRVVGGRGPAPHPSARSVGMSPARGRFVDYSS